MTISDYTSSAIERFWSHVNRTEDKDACWEWMGFRTYKGYGNYKLCGHTRGTHRTAYLFSIGEIPSGMHVLHHCDNRACCNPSHLFIGTNTDNMRDKEAKGRGNQPKGENNGKSKLKTAQVIEMRQRYANGDILQKTLATEYGVEPQTIWNILHRKTWAYL